MKTNKQHLAATTFQSNTLISYYFYMNTINDTKKKGVKETAEKGKSVNRDTPQLVSENDAKQSTNEKGETK